MDTDLSSFPKLADGAYNLTNANLSGAYLVNADLSGANLNNVNLSGANPTGTNLTGVNFNQANLKGANLSRATLSGAIKSASANLSEVTWSSTTCPDGSNSNNDGGTCVGNLG